MLKDSPPLLAYLVRVNHSDCDRLHTAPVNVCGKVSHFQLLWTFGHVRYNGIHTLVQPRDSSGNWQVRRYCALTR